MSASGQGSAQSKDETSATFAFQEYLAVMEDTAKITDRRQTVNTLFVTINALFLTGVGYLLYVFFQANHGSQPIILYTFGFLAIAVITTVINDAWLNLSESSRRLIDLRIRYLEALENHLRESGYFPSIMTRLLGADADRDDPKKEYEAPPLTFPGAEDKHPDAAGDPRRWLHSRGTYSLEEALYHNPYRKKVPFGFTRAEQRIGHTFTRSYWVALAISILFALPQALAFMGVHATIGPLHF